MVNRITLHGDFMTVIGIIVNIYHQFRPHSRQLNGNHQRALDWTRKLHTTCFFSIPHCTRHQHQPTQSPINTTMTHLHQFPSYYPCPKWDKIGCLVNWKNNLFPSQKVPQITPHCSINCILPFPTSKQSHNSAIYVSMGWEFGPIYLILVYNPHRSR